MIQQEEFYYKGIYPVEVVVEASKLEGHDFVTVRVKRRFLHTDNYSRVKQWVKPGELLKVPARLVWSHRRRFKHRKN